MSYCLWKLFFDSNLPQTPSNLIYLIFLVTFTLFQPKLEAIKWQKVLNIALLGTVFPILSLRLKFGIKRISSLFLGERRARGGGMWDLQLPKSRSKTSRILIYRTNKVKNTVTGKLLIECNSGRNK